MTRTRPWASTCVVLAGLVALTASGNALAQPVDCTDIYDVSDFDGPSISNFSGFLATIRVAGPPQIALPLFVTSPPGDVHRLFIVGQNGVISLVKDGVLQPAPFLDMSSIVLSETDGGQGDQGLLGLAFHPDYATNGRFFVQYTDNSGERDVVARYSRDPSNPDVADPDTRLEIISFLYPNAVHHFGGMLAFSPVDRRLYVSTGDGGDPCDLFGNSQDLGSNLGKILRLDVDSVPYSTAGNPFDGSIPGNDEIWAYGLRNPWRFSFDRANGAMYIGDVGQSVREEIDCQPPASAGGENYGWVQYEGFSCPNPSCGSTSCSFPNVLPILDYAHQNPAGFSCSVTGGYVYRGCRMKDLRGSYFFADFCSGFIRSFRTDPACGVGTLIDRKVDLKPEGLAQISLITSFGEDARGELFITGRFDGVFKIVPALAITELSGPNAPPFLAGIQDWTWESLPATSGYPVFAYRIYRSSSPSSGFTCVHGPATNVWPGGDPENPPAGHAFYYLVTALAESGEESPPGKGSGGVPRVVDTGSACAS